MTEPSTGLFRYVELSGACLASVRITLDGTRPGILEAIYLGNAAGMADVDQDSTGFPINSIGPIQKGVDSAIYMGFVNYPGQLTTIPQIYPTSISLELTTSPRPIYNGSDSNNLFAFAGVPGCNLTMTVPVRDWNENWRLFNALTYWSGAKDQWLAIQMDVPAIGIRLNTWLLLTTPVGQNLNPITGLITVSASAVAPFTWTDIT